MAEHLHGYPACAAPTGQPCPASDLHFDECESHGTLVSCGPSVVDGIPTGQYRCAHRDGAAAAPRVTEKPKASKAPSAGSRSQTRKPAAPATKKSAKKSAKTAAKTTQKSPKPRKAAGKVAGKKTSGGSAKKKSGSRKTRGKAKSAPKRSSKPRTSAQAKSKKGKKKK